MDNFLMSTKATIFLTNDGDHWYEDTSTFSRTSTHEKYNFNVHLQISKKDVVSFEYREIEDTYFIEIDGDSELAKNIKNLKNNH